MRSAVQKAFGDKMQALARQKVAQSELTGAAGGYLVPQEMRLDIDAGFLETSVFAATCFTIDMQRAEIHLPRLAITAAHAAGVSPMFGGMAFTWNKQQGQTLAETEPVFQDNALLCELAQGIVVASNQLVQDGGEALAQYLTWAAVECMAWGVDYACFNGNGINQPLGVINSPAVNRVTRTGGGSIVQQDLANMISGLLPACFRRAIWCCSPTSLTDICNLSAYFVNTGLDSANGLVGTLFGRPLYVTEKLPALGTTGDILLMDPVLYALASRQLEVAASDQVPGYFERNQVVYRFIWRGNGQPLVNGTATLADGTTTAGAFVTLTT